VATVITKPHYS